MRIATGNTGASLHSCRDLTKGPEAGSYPCRYGLSESQSTSQFALPTEWN
jgi:hypothetical protein